MVQIQENSEGSVGKNEVPFADISAPKIGESGTNQNTWFRRLLRLLSRQTINLSLMLWKGELFGEVLPGEWQNRGHSRPLPAGQPGLRLP
jgi:hypothetical protein